MSTTSFSAIIEFGIEREIKFADFYRNASEKSRFARIKNMFLTMASTKESQRQELFTILSEIRNKMALEVDFPLDDYKNLDDVKFGEWMSYNELRQEGMKLEEYSKAFYKTLSSSTQDERYKEVFAAFAVKASENQRLFEEQEFGK